MFASILSGRHANLQARPPNRRLVGRIDAALAALPAPWQVLRNRRPGSADGPPWVKYIVLHPKKGIALVDVLPTNPHAAIAPLDDFLQRTGFMAFSRGDPPIVAVALAERDLAALADCLSGSFAAAPRCGIKNSSWTEAAIELLLTTPGLLLTRMERDTGPMSKAREAVIDEPRREAPRPPVAAEPEPVQISPDLGEPAGATSKAAPPPEPGLARNPVQVSADRDEEAEEASSEPAPQPEPSRAREPKLGAFDEPDWRTSHLTSFEHRGAKRRPGKYLLLTAPAAAAAIMLVAYPHFTGQRSAETAAPRAAATQLPESPSVAALAPAASDVGLHPDKATDVAPPRAATPAPLAAAALPPAPKVEAPPPNAPPAQLKITEPADAKRPVPEIAAKTASASPPTPSPENTAKVAPRPQPPAPSAPQHRVKVANVNPVPLVPADRGLDSRETPLAIPMIAGPSATAAPPPEEETVTIDGTTYVRGREPHALGVLTEPLGDPRASIPPVAPTPVPEQESGYNQVLIQPE